MPLDHEQAWPLAQRIASGHAWAEHQDEFSEVAGTDEFAILILRLLTAATDERPLRWERFAYWDEPSGTIVITSPVDPDRGTCFRPTDGRVFFETVP